MLLEELFFNLGNIVEQNVDVREIEFALSVRNVASHSWQQVLIDEDQSV